jgi:TPR repeat protein
MDSVLTEKGIVEMYPILGKCYYHGFDGTEIDKTEADKWFKLAAEANIL